MDVCGELTKMRDTMEGASQTWVEAMMDALEEVKEQSASYIAAEIEDALGSFEPDVSGAVEYALEHSDYFDRDRVTDIVRDFVHDHDLQDEDKVNSLIDSKLADYEPDLDDVLDALLNRLDPKREEAMAAALREAETEKARAAGAVDDLVQRDKELEVLKQQLASARTALELAGEAKLGEQTERSDNGS